MAKNYRKTRRNTRRNMRKTRTRRSRRFVGGSQDKYVSPLVVNQVRY